MKVQMDLKLASDEPGGLEAEEVEEQGGRSLSDREKHQWMVSNQT